MIHNKFIRNMFQVVVNKIGLEQTIINSVIVLGIILIYAYVIYNFIHAKTRKDKKEKEVKSVVETASMSAFFIAIAFVINLGCGTYSYHNTILNIIFLALYIISIATNLLGRYYLGNNWGNNVVIYTDQTLVTNGVYKIVRHPLYASIIWAIYAIGVLRSNYCVFILNTFVFIPFMYYRAKQEEKELVKVFKKYEDYQKKTGMFFPNIIKMIGKGK
ncbi:MAG: isoprenylcysteine carboxylmethyltransferase family protein [Bacilli bacterium]|nr:isoprenylcysteine carboxylmethyltransferase family protein [Bacilli bacterium]MBQ7241011.1 isoprenylcysteine carboxylmethyltransferase family protein [Bacilli bacterium]